MEYDESSYSPQSKKTWWEQLHISRVLPGEDFFNAIIDRFSPLERALFTFFVLLLITGAVAAIAQVRTAVTTIVPASGGNVAEGMVGSPRFINPVLAISDTDRDMTTLVFTGLLRADPAKGLVPDLAKRYSISEDGTVYHFILRDDAYFHDGYPVTADDVIFTIQLVQDSNLKSPKRADWDGVLVEKLNDRELTITLPKPFAPFLENATLGILPKHRWEGLTAQEIPFSDLNTDPIGAGPFKVSRVSKNKEGIPTGYRLVRNRLYTLGTPHLSSITIVFFNRTDDLANAWRTGSIDLVASLSPTSYERTSSYTLEHGTFPRVFAVFFNQDRNTILRDKAVRDALNSTLDKEHLVQNTLGSYATAIDSPVITSGSPKAIEGVDLTYATDVLQKAGWQKNADINVWEKNGTRLSFTLATANVPELKRVAESIAETWRLFGIEVSVSVFEPSDLQQSVIRPRQYDALLFGEAVGREPDLFAFWHSSQREDPGLNVALYANKDADDILARARATTDTKERARLHEAFEKLVTSDMPAVFLYTPDFLYGVSSGIYGINLGTVSTQSERFGNIHEWYRHTERVWEFLSS